ncbi:toll/interleukin-1 receptor domain-containing protein [Runella sp.]|uniref:toll/interleukin-1 receptor domain-containing protein n=1 Tax=Runella sp. TaxID=1960881 RepID=UPI003D11F356
MKVFISWSGDRSRLVAELLNNWLQRVLQNINPWLSTKDIDRGSLWYTSIAGQLAETNNGIVCLTKSNINKPWILFEAGALAKGLPSNRVFTFLIDLDASDVFDPLAQFNHTIPTKQSVYQLVSSINRGLVLNNQGLKDEVLQEVFDTFWPKFEEQFRKILEDTNEEGSVTVEKPSGDEVLNEILTSVRAMDRRLRKIEDKSYSAATSNTVYEDLDKTLDLPIEVLDLRQVIIKFLKSVGVSTIRQVVNLDIGTYHSLSKSGKDEILGALQNIGITPHWVSLFT